MSENHRPRILIVDDDPIVGDSLAMCLQHAGETVEVASTAHTALEKLTAADQVAGDPHPFGVVLVDLVMPEMDGMELLRRLRDADLPAVPLVLTGYATVPRAIEAIKLGAMDLLMKPVVEDELLLAIEKAMQQFMLRSDNVSLRKQIDHAHGLDGIVAHDDRMQRIFQTVEAVAPTKSTVLMNGESGTGKSLIARAIHRRSTRASGPFIELACGSIPETLLESELFGHVKGAFTGAHADHQGRFLAAHGGTLFLDEINSASPGMQLKLLRVLQERSFEPVGSNKTVEVDVRIILASNQPLQDLVDRGQFRQDLFYRINVVAIDLPPLRERSADIPMLATHFLDQHTRELGKSLSGFTDEAMGALERYTFPGNVRELQNVVERAAILAEGPRIRLADLPDPVLHGQPRRRTASESPWSSQPLETALAEAERAILKMALEANGWNRQQTAEALEINRTTLYKKMRALGLDGRDS